MKTNVYYLSQMVCGHVLPIAVFIGVPVWSDDVGEFLKGSKGVRGTESNN